nr:unnamed protein product [Callosobruchus analis]
MIQSDHRTVVAYLRSQGGTTSQNMYLLTKKILLYAKRLNVALIPCYIPGGRGSYIQRLIRNGLASKSTIGIPRVQMLGSSEDRSICYESFQSGDSICNDRTNGLKRPVCECFQQSVGLRSGMGISTPTLDTESDSTSEQCKGHIPCGGSQMDKSVLEDRIKGKSDSRTSCDEELGHPFSGPSHGSPTSGYREHGFGGMDEVGYLSSRLVRRRCQATEDSMERICLGHVLFGVEGLGQMV